MKERMTMRIRVESTSISMSAILLYLCLSWQQLNAFTGHATGVRSLSILQPSSISWKHGVCLNVRQDDDEQDDYLDDDDEDEVDYGKFQPDTKMRDDDDEDDGSVSPLPEFLNTSEEKAQDSKPAWMSSSSSSSTPPPSSTLDETQRRMEEQQRQIDTLMKLVQEQQKQKPQESLFSTPEPMDFTVSTTTQNVAPLKAMLFVDGTWLYYSIHERSEERCPIVQRYGRGWQFRYSFDWAALPRIICEQLQLQNQQAAWGTTRPVELVRVSVYTSMKKDTSPFSNRIKMFEEMKQANYDVFMMETVGGGEKCIDIQLAVEMLHYATVQNAYDVAILLSGDKDFLPALIRTRQKGRQVAIVSMRSGCNRALCDTPNVKDYNVVWIEDFLDQLIVPKAGSTAESSSISVFTLTKVIYDFIDQSGLSRVSSRDMGRYLKQIKVADRSLLDELKQCYGGLYQFLSMSGCFDVLKRTPNDDQRRMDPTDKSFWIGLHENADELLLLEAKGSHFSPQEKDFFDEYSLDALIDQDKAYFLSREMGGPEELFYNDINGHVAPMALPEALKRDYSGCKVAELKEICRERGLPVSGTKAQLIERVQSDVEREVMELQQQHKARTTMKRPHIPGRLSGDRHSRIPSSPNKPQGSYSEAEKYLEGLVREYVQARGGKASSRDVGRYLATNKGSGQYENFSQGHQSALAELKGLYGGLAAYIMNRQDSFVKLEGDPNGSSDYEFQVGLRGPN